MLMDNTMMHPIDRASADVVSTATPLASKTGTRKIIRPKSSIGEMENGHSVTQVDSPKKSSSPSAITSAWSDFSDDSSVDEGSDKESGNHVALVTPEHKVQTEGLLVQKLKSQLQKYKQQLATLPRSQGKVDVASSDPVNVFDLLTKAKEQTQKAIDCHTLLSSLDEGDEERALLLHQAETAQKAAGFFEKAAADLKNAYSVNALTKDVNDAGREQALQQARENYQKGMRILNPLLKKEVGHFDNDQDEEVLSQVSSLTHDDIEDFPTDDEFLEFARQQTNVATKISNYIATISVDEIANEQVHIPRYQQLAQEARDAADYFSQAAIELKQNNVEVAASWDQAASKVIEDYEQEYASEMKRLIEKGVFKLAASVSGEKITTPRTQTPNVNFEEEEVEEIENSKISDDQQSIISDVGNDMASIASDSEEARSIAGDEIDNWEAKNIAVKQTLASMEQRELVRVRQFAAEEMNAEGFSPYAAYALERGVTSDIVHLFESCRAQAVAAYQKGETDLALQWGKATQYAQESIDYKIQAGFAAAADSFGDLTICYHEASKLMNQCARLQASLLQHQAGKTIDATLYAELKKANLYALEAVNIYDRSIEAFQMGNRKEGQSLQHTASYYQDAARFLGEYVYAMDQARIALDVGKNKDAKKWTTIANKVFDRAQEKIKSCADPMKARLAEEKEELLETVHHYQQADLEREAAVLSNAVRQGKVDAAMVRDFESYRNKAIQALEAGNDDLAAQWTKIAEDAKEGLSYYQQSVSDNSNDYHLFVCYQGAAKSMQGLARSQAEFLTMNAITPQAEEQIVFGVQIEEQFTRAIDYYQQAVRAFQARNQVNGKFLQRTADQCRRCATYFEQSLNIRLEDPNDLRAFEFFELGINELRPPKIISQEE